MRRRAGRADPHGPMPHDVTAPTVVIVHGAWVDGTSWRDVVALLHVLGLSVIAVQNPLSALKDDVDAVVRAIERQPGPVVLVGHGYGGTVITQAGDHPSVAALVYVAACAPDSASRRLMRRRWGFVARCRHLRRRRWWVSIPAFGCRRGILAHDLSAAEVESPRRFSQPSGQCALDRVTRAVAYQTPRYAVTDDDRMIAPALQRELAAESMCVSSPDMPDTCRLSRAEGTVDVILGAVDCVRAMPQRD